MRGKIYIETIPTQYETHSKIGEVVEILEKGGEIKMVICDIKDSRFFSRDINWCKRIKSLDDPTPYYQKKDNKKH